MKGVHSLPQETWLGPGFCALVRKASWCPGKDTGPEGHKLHVSPFPGGVALGKSFYLLEPQFPQ